MADAVNPAVMVDVDQLIQKANQALAEIGVECKTCQHEAVFTCPTHLEEFEKVAHEDVKNGTALCKNLFMKVKKKKTLWLVVLRADRKIQNNILGKYLGASGLRFVNEDQLQTSLGVGKGAVTPLAIINDAEKDVQVVIDEALLKCEYLGVHPLTNAATTSISPDQLLAFIRHHGNEAQIVDFDKELVLPEKSSAPKQKKAQKKQKKKKKKGATLLGIEVGKDENFGKWFSEVVTKGELIDYYDISGCYILRPDSYFIWEQIQYFFNKYIRQMGVRNAYFPLFVSKSALEAEADHIEGFAPEVAWVTKSGQSDLHEPIAIRPTSETIMYPAYAKWIHSHRDLPLKLNQWSNVVRWEFKHPTPFIRTREFLWQEGHSAFATKPEADKEVLDILDLYARVYEELLSIPVIKGRKTDIEKFPGGDYTTTVEAFIKSTGRGAQGATSHGLGQHFGKIFDIVFEDENATKQIPFQNSWGLSTRTIGVMVMQHSDDKGLVLPPRVAYVQAVIVPIVFKEGSASKLRDTYEQLAEELRDGGVRVHVDDRENYNPGWKYNHWEVKGTPIRIELGPKDMDAKQCVLCRRDTGAKEVCQWDDLVDRVKSLLDEIQQNLLDTARAKMEESKITALNWEEFMNALDHKNMAFSPSCNESKCEEAVKIKTGAASRDDGEEEEEGDQEENGEKFEKLTGAAKTLCIPFSQPDLPNDAKCVGCGEKATTWILYGRSY